MATEPSKHQKFVMERWDRSAIKPHPKNPRIISEGARKKLKNKMAEVGLLQPLIINRTTGYLLGGHQRLASMDALERYKPGKNDYSIDVAVVELDEKEELGMLAFLNNVSAQGQWDLEMLASMAADDGVDFEGMGFDKVDIEMMFDGDARFDSVFGDSMEVIETKDALQAVREDGRSGKSALDEFREKGAKNISSDFYVTVVCKDQAEKRQLMEHLGIPRGEQYISPAEIMALRR